MYCEHCQTTAAEGARFCNHCGGKLTSRAVAAMAAGLAADAPTVALTIGPCESCGAPSLPGSTLCLPCTRAFESILGSQSTAPTADMPAYRNAVPAYEAATLLQAQAPALPSAPVAAPPAAQAVADDEPLADDEEYVDDDTPDDLMADEAATVLVTAPAPEPEPAFSASPEWTPAPELTNVDGIVAIAPWARKGPDADEAPESLEVDAPSGADALPFWERSGQDAAVAAAKPEVARYVPPPSVAPPPSASLESSVARQHMRPKGGTLAAPVAGRAGGRNRTLLIAAALAGIAAIGTPVMWKLAFADRRTTVSALTYEPAATPVPAPAPRPERTHGTPAPEPPRVYQDLLPPAPEPVAPPPAAVVAAPSAPAASRTPVKPTKKPGQPAAPEPIAPVVAPPEPALLVASPPPVAQVHAEAAPAPPSQIHAEAVPLGKLFEISQVDERPQVTNRFEPVLPARLSGAPQPVVVIVRVLISPSGRAAEASSLRNPTNDEGLAAAAVATVRQWTFAPAKKKGQPVSCWYNVGVAFRPAAGN